MSKETWVAKTSGDFAPTIQSAIDPILDEFGFKAVDGKDNVQYERIREKAYQAAINAIAETQSYYQDHKSILGGSSLYDLAIGDAVTKAFRNSDDKATDFQYALQHACRGLAEHYRPKGGHAISGGDARKPRRPSAEGNES